MQLALQHWQLRDSAGSEDVEEESTRSASRGFDKIVCRTGSMGDSTYRAAAQNHWQPVAQKYRSVG